jgi:hypothetical protein
VFGSFFGRCQASMADDPERRTGPYTANASMHGLDGGGAELVIGPPDIHVKITARPQAFDLPVFPCIRQSR